MLVYRKGDSKEVLEKCKKCEIIIQINAKGDSNVI